MSFQPGANLYGVAVGTHPEGVEVPFITTRAPTTSDTLFSIGKNWIDTVAGNVYVLTSFSSIGGVLTANWVSGGNNLATTTTPGIVQLSTLAQLQTGTAPAGAVPVSNDVTTVINAIVVGAVPPATETQAGIAEIATQAETNTGTDDTRIVTPLKLATYVAGGSGAGSFTDLTATGTVTFTGVTGALSMTSTSSSSLGVTGAGIDLTLDSDAGQLILTGGEAAVNAVRIQADDAAGGIDIDAGSGGITVDTTGAISLDSATASNFTVTGAADLTVRTTAGSLNLLAGEAVADAIVMTASAGGIDITATGSAGVDLDILNSGGSVNVTATENAALAIFLHANGGASETIQVRADQGTGAASVQLLSDVGGITLTGGVGSANAINLTTSSAAGGITMTAGTAGILPSTTGNFTVISTANAATAIELHANGGTSETIRIRSDQGTAATSLDLLSDVGGITLSAGLGTADAINLVTSNAAGGIDIDAGTAGFIVDTTGAISLDGAAASNFTLTGAFDLTLNTTAGSVIVQGGEAAVDAITINASDAAGGIDMNAGSGGVTVDTTAAISLDSATASNFTVTGAADLSLISTAGSVVLNGGEAAVDAITITASNGAGGVDINAGTGGITADTTAAISLDSATASNFTVTGAADLTLNSTGGAVNVTSGETNADSVVITSAGGMDLTATGAAGKDTDIVNTNGSVNISGGESVIDAVVITAGGAAGGVQVVAGTNGILLNSGLKVKVTTVATAASPYTVLGTDYFISTNSTAGALTINLPATPATGRVIVVYDGVGQAAIGGNVTVSGNGNNIAITGVSGVSAVLNTAYESMILTYNGTIWCGQGIV